VGISRVGSSPALGNNKKGCLLKAAFFVYYLHADTFTGLLRNLYSIPSPPARGQAPAGIHLFFYRHPGAGRDPVEETEKKPGSHLGTLPTATSKIKGSSHTTLHLTTH